MRRPKGLLLLAALFLGRFPGPDECSHYVSSQLTPLLVDRCMGLGPCVAPEQREGFLVGFGNLPPLVKVPSCGLYRRMSFLEATAFPPLWVRPTSKLVLNNTRYTRSVCSDFLVEGGSVALLLALIHELRGSRILRTSPVPSYLYI